MKDSIKNYEIIVLSSSFYAWLLRETYNVQCNTFILQVGSNAEGKRWL